MSIYQSRGKFTRLCVDHIVSIIIHNGIKTNKYIYINNNNKTFYKQLHFIINKKIHTQTIHVIKTLAKTNVIILFLIFLAKRQSYSCPKTGQSSKQGTKENRRYNSFHAVRNILFPEAVSAPRLNIDIMFGYFFKREAKLFHSEYCVYKKNVNCEDSFVKFFINCSYIITPIPLKNLNDITYFIYLY